MSKKSKDTNITYQEPPWVWGPTEGYQWANVAYKGEMKHKHQPTVSPNFISNPHLEIDLKVKKNIVMPDSELKKLLFKKFGLTRVHEHFDIIVTAEKFLAALNRVKFKNVHDIKIDRKVIYSHPEIKKDIKETIELLVDQGENWRSSNSIRIKASNEKSKLCKVSIKIKRVHSKNEHTIDIEFDGEIRKNVFKQFINYIKKNLEVQEIID
jgi:hypothetical protein